MNIYISADMEGVAGVTHMAQTRPSFPDYARFRRLLTAEVSAAVAGAVEAGAERVVVNDGHLAMTNIVIEELHPAAELISGTNKLLGQMEGIDETFDGVFFVGHHQGDGIGDGVISHTLMSAALRRVRVNGVVVDEASLNARVAGAFGVPAVLMTGDDAVCTDAEQAMPGIVVAPVKTAISRLCARSLGVEAARALIQERAAAAVRKLRDDAPAPIAVDGPVRFDVEFRQTAAAHFCTLFPGVERTSATEIAFEHDSMVAAFRHFWGLATLGLSVQDGVFGTGL